MSRPKYIINGKFGNGIQAFAQQRLPLEQNQSE